MKHDFKSIKYITSCVVLAVLINGCSYKNLDVNNSTEFSIVKNKEENNGLYDYERYLITKIDEKSPEANKFSFSETEYLVTKGDHTISVVIDFNRNIPVKVGTETLQQIGPYVAEISINKNFNPGQKLKINGHIYPVDKLVGIWIEDDSTGRKVSDEVKVKFRSVTLGEVMQNTYIPSP
ncbi:MAG: hypothetical protein COA44_14500 [Arcobacter sp.]|nr:MAG: hypothetical protein COA44_14500 [Arcobacter sp.]